MTLTKSDIVEDLNNQIGLNKREAKELVDSVFNTIKETLINGEEVKVSGFGNFQLKDKPARPGRNPRTGEDVEITARRVVTFKSGGNKSFLNSVRLKEEATEDITRDTMLCSSGISKNYYITMVIR